MNPISAILAVDDFFGIGKNNFIPWDSKEDLQFFKSKTINNIVIMGSTTWNGLPYTVKSSLVDNRFCIVLSSNQNNIHDIFYHNFLITDNINNALNYAQSMFPFKHIFFIGGATLFKHVFDLNILDDIFITSITGNYNCDTFVPFFASIFNNPKWLLVEKYNLNTFSTMSHFKKYHEEYQYLNILKYILINGSFFNDRTGTGIYSIFGANMHFDCSIYFPLLTTKKTFLKGIIHELIWFINGSTNSLLLENNGVNIWKGNTSREYLDNNGFFDRDVGDIGPGYGHQWRHWNATYFTCNSNYTDKGIDQLKLCINNILSEKNSNIHNRRNILLAWNPEQIDQMSLPPCHILVQFYLNSQSNKLDLHMYQRSADMFLGVPFNIASYALLLKIVAKITNTFPNMLHMSFGDAHIYKNHIDAVRTQLSNSPFKFPTLDVNVSSLDDISPDDFILNNYISHKSIKAPMAV